MLYRTDAFTLETSPKRFTKKVTPFSTAPLFKSCGDKPNLSVPASKNGRLKDQSGVLGAFRLDVTNPLQALDLPL